MKDETIKLLPEPDFKLLFQSVPGLYLVLLPNLTVVAVSDAYLKATMTKREEITGRGLFDVFPDNPDDSESSGVLNLKASLLYVVQHKCLHTMAVQKYDIRRPDGTFETRYWELINSPVLNAQNELAYIIHNVSDVTEKQVVKDKYRKSQKDFQSLVSSVKDYAIVMLDINGNIDSWNSGAKAIKGYEAEEIIGKPMNVFYTEEQIAAGEPKANLQKAIEYGHYETEGFRVKKDGSQFYANVVLTPLYENGKLHGYAKVTKDITEKAKAEDTIRLLATITDNIHDTLIATDNNSLITNWNSGAEKLLGWKLEQVLGRPLKKILKAGFPNGKQNNETMAALAQNDVWRGELIYYTMTGTPVNVLVTQSHLNDARGAQKGTLILARDITKRRLAEEALKKLNTELEQRVKERTEDIAKSERRMRALIENSDDIISMIDENMFPVYMSPSAGRVTGYLTEADVKMGIEAVHPDDVENIRNGMAEIIKAPGKSVFVTYRLKHKNGHYIWLEGTFNNLLHDPFIGAIVGNMRDITERKKAGERIIKALEEKNTILESIGDAFFAIDKDWTVNYWNKVAETELGQTKEKVVGKNLWEIFPHRIGTVSYQKYHEAMARNEAVQFESYYSVLNRWYEVSAYPSESGLSVYFKDVTERRKAAEEITKLNLELEGRVLVRTEQLKKSVDEMEAFCYSISHDLRAPLRSIIGFTNILEKEYASKLDDEAKRIAGVIKRNTSKMGVLIDDLLSFSRTEKMELIKIDIDSNAVVKQVIDDVNSNETWGKIEWAIHPLPTVKADLNTIMQVWVNLISNAVKYSGNEDKPRIEIGAVQKNGSVLFFIKDNGVGFDEKYKSKLFKVFQRLHSNQEFEGTGIGLAIVEKIISKHGGEVWAESKLNEGATFYFCLPVDEEPHISNN